ncbi:MAG: hypothetical protein IPK22_15905 [Verrucomicrobiaceae bacterium]|nr:hypothetical protein [Verrucomicrobiaceae bacterium]
MDSVTALDPGNPATVGVSFDGSNVRFTFGIPRGNDGGNGRRLPRARPAKSISPTRQRISGTSASTNSVSTMDSPLPIPTWRRCGRS